MPEVSGYWDTPQTEGAGTTTGAGTTDASGASGDWWADALKALYLVMQNRKGDGGKVVNVDPSMRGVQKQYSSPFVTGQQQAPVRSMPTLGSLIGGR